MAAALSDAISILTAARDRVIEANEEHGWVLERGVALQAIILALDVLSEALNDKMGISVAEAHATALPFFVGVGSDEGKASTYATWPVWYAAHHGNAAAVELLIEAGFDVKARTWLGETPAYAAARHGHAAALDLLIKAGCDVNAANEAGLAPAHAAAQHGHASALKLLIQAGCDVNAASSELAFEGVSRGPYSEEFDVLIFEGVDNGRTPAHYAAECSRAAELELLINAGCDVNAATSTGRTPAYLAAKNGHAAALGLLIKAGCTLHHDGDPPERRLLSVAARAGHHECVRALMRAGVELVEDGELGRGNPQMNAAPEHLRLMAVTSIDESEIF